MVAASAWIDRFCNIIGFCRKRENIFLKSRINFNLSDSRVRHLWLFLGTGWVAFSSVCQIWFVVNIWQIRQDGPRMFPSARYDFICSGLSTGFEFVTMVTMFLNVLPLSCVPSGSRSGLYLHSEPAFWHVTSFAVQQPIILSVWQFFHGSLLLLVDLV